MTKEEKFVAGPLKRYFRSRKRSRAQWEIKHSPAHETSATGWDLQVERVNRVLLIEAKYIRGPAAAAIAGLTVAPLVYRPEKMKHKNLYRSRYFCICWAIGCGYKGGKRDQRYRMSGIYQILFDCLILNLDFWKHYSRILKVEYIYFVDAQKVAKISFNRIINLAAAYRLQLDKYLINAGRKVPITDIDRRRVQLRIKRVEAENLSKTIKFV